MIQSVSYKKRWVSERIISIAVAILIIAVCGTTAAQPQTAPKDTSFNIQLFKPAPGPMNFFAIESPEIGDDMMPAVAIMLAYERRPFVIYNCDDDECGDDVSPSGQRSGNTIYAVDNLVTADILGSFNFLKYFQVGLALPLTVYQNGQGFEHRWDASTNDNWLEPGKDYSTVFALGDLRLHLKARFIGKDGKDGPSLAVAIIPTLPLWEWIGYGQESKGDNNYGYGGDDSVSVTAPRVIFGYRFGPLRFAISADVLWRKEVKLFNAEIGHVLNYGGALGYTIIPEIELIAEIFGNKSLISANFSDAESAPLAFMAGGRFKAGDFFFHLAGGGGILSGVGVPQFQIIGGAGWAPAKDEEEEEFVINEWDVDGDGIDNDVDECPEKPEDLDGFQDEDGCQDDDNDNDGIVDGYDSCPMEPEDKDGFRDLDGCPDLDHDEDGIKEPTDKCPEKSEDFDEYEDEDGCPEEDNDKDGIADPEDFCPNEAEDIDEFQDGDGCPDLDNDADGVPDATDKCPNEPETLNGIKDDDGCPDRGKALVIVTNEKIELRQMVQFKTNSNEIKGAKSFEILDIVAKVLAGNTSVRVTIEGHTDNRGNAAKNRDLSKRRADSVKNYLAGKGIDDSRLETSGWGPDRPIESNKTKNGRAANRRVEFIIINPKTNYVAPEEEEAPAPAADDGGMDFTSGDDGSMDFSGGDEGDGSSGDEMDFTAE